MDVKRSPGARPCCFGCQLCKGLEKSEHSGNASIRTGGRRPQHPVPLRQAVETAEFDLLADGAKLAHGLSGPTHRHGWPSVDPMSADAFTKGNACSSPRKVAAVERVGLIAPLTRLSEPFRPRAVCLTVGRVRIACRIARKIVLGEAT